MLPFQGVNTHNIINSIRRCHNANIIKAFSLLNIEEDVLALKE